MRATSTAATAVIVGQQAVPLGGLAVGRVARHVAVGLLVVLVVVVDVLLAAPQRHVPATPKQLPSSFYSTRSPGLNLVCLPSLRGSDSALAEDRFLLVEQRMFCRTSSAVQYNPAMPHATPPSPQCHAVGRAAAASTSRELQKLARRIDSSRSAVMQAEVMTARLWLADVRLRASSALLTSALCRFRAELEGYPSPCSLYRRRLLPIHPLQPVSSDYIDRCRPSKACESGDDGGHVDLVAHVMSLLVQIWRGFCSRAWKFKAMGSAVWLLQATASRHAFVRARLHELAMAYCQGIDACNWVS